MAGHHRPTPRHATPRLLGRHLTCAVPSASSMAAPTLTIWLSTCFLQQQVFRAFRGFRVNLQVWLSTCFLQQQQRRRQQVR